MIKRLLKIANELDRKGFREEADTLDKIAEDWMGRDDSFAASMGGQAETSDLDMASLRSGAVEEHDAAMAAEPGKIRPAGDRFTYDYISEGDYFVVATAPEKQSFAVGAKLEKGTQAYNTLFDSLSESAPEILAEIKRKETKREEAAKSKEHDVLAEQILSTKLDAPEFDGHSLMRSLYADVESRLAKNVDTPYSSAPSAMEMFEAAKVAITDAYREGGLTLEIADSALSSNQTSNLFNSTEKRDYLEAIKPLIRGELLGPARRSPPPAYRGPAPEAADIQALEGPAAK